MSANATRVRTSRIVDTIGVIAVALGLILGLVPGVALPVAQADESCDDSGSEFHPNFTFERLRMELTKLSGPGEDSLVVDTTDDNVTCAPGTGNSLAVYLDGVLIETEDGLADSPYFHLSCSVSYTGTTMTIGDTTYNTDSMIFDSRGPNNGGEECTAFPSEITVSKVDAEGKALAGAEFTLYEGDGTDDPVIGTCTTGTSGICSFGDVTPDGYPQDYTIDETIVPAGYKKAAGLPETKTLTTDTDLVFGPYTDPRIEYEIDVTPDGRNAVGNTHDFTVTLNADGAPLAGATLNLAWSGVGSIQSPGSSCTTDAAGTCTVTVSSDDAGSGVLTATFDTPYQNDNGQTAGPDLDDEVSVGTNGTVYDKIADAATKVWVGYVATIEADGTNLVGDAHTFTATVWEVDGQGSPDGVVAEDVTVTVTWTGAPTGSTISPPDLDCVTNASGQCSFTVNSPDNSGAGTITIVQLDGVIAGIGGQADESLSDDTPSAAPDGSLSAVKTWREYRASIDDDSVNPVGQAHTFNVTVQYSDDGGTTWNNPGADIEVDWTGPTPDGTNDLGASTCDDGTDADGTCTIVVTSGSPGEGTVTVTGVDGDLVPGGTTDESFDVPDVQAKKTWLDFTVDIDGPYINLVGEPETFTVTVKRSDDGDTYGPVQDGSVIVWSDSTDGRVSDQTCDDGTVAGQCTITVLSSTPGTFDISVTGIDDYAEFDTPADVTFTTPAQSSKTWVDYRAFIEADGVNLVGDDHTFTVTAQVDDGTGWGDVEDGTVVTVTASGLAATVDQTDCADGTLNGTCDVVVDSDDPGTVTITVDTVSNETAVDSPVLTVDVDGGENLEQDQSASADKTWIEYRASIEESATNLTGEEHVFTVTAEQDSGSGWGDVPDGTAVGFSTDNDGTVQSDTCDSTSGGQCTITVDSSAVDEVTVTVTSVAATDVDDGPWATLDNGALSATSQGSLEATKAWISVRVDVDADETNVVGETHVFTVDVELVTPDGTIDAPNGTTVAISTSGTVGTVTSQTCDVPGTTDGQCTVTVDSASPGDLVISADSVSFTYDATPFTVDFTTEDSTVGEADGQDLTATKTWRDYRVSIEAHDLNRVRESHTFTVTIEQTDDGSTWTDAPDGTTATVAISGTAGSITGGTCETTGTVDGDCTVVVDSSTPGTGTVTVSEISVDLPEEDRTGIPVDVTDDSADKTWAAFQALISPDAVNVTGDSHDFTLTGQYTVDGSTWLDVPDGSSIGFSDSGVGSTTGDTCDSTVDGDCTVTVTSATGGDRVVTVTGIDPAAITVTGPDGDIVRDFGLVTLADDAVGIAPGTDTDVSATKTWASYALQLEPATATNLLSGQEGDTERYHTITATLSSDDATNAPVGGQTIDVAITGDGVIDSVESGNVGLDGLSGTCVTDTDGTCDIVIFSDAPGQATLSGSFEATVGESEPVTVDGNDAVKTWTTFRVTVTPETAVNLVDNPHVFTVKVEQSNDDGVWVPVVGTTPTIDVTGTDLTVDTSDCDAGTDSNGECTVTVTSGTVQAVTLTATHTESYDDYDSEVQGQSTVGFSDTGDKTWIDYAIDVSPDTDENLVGTDHVFTVTVKTTFPGETGTTTQPVVGANPAIVLSGLGSITDSTCDDEAGTDVLGQCTVTISSAAPGSSTLTATYLGTATDDEEIREYADSGDKLWVDYLLEISDDAVNAVGDEHTFTATLTVDTGEGFGPAAGETLAFTVDGVGTVTGGDVDEALECTTDEAGECDILINSDESGATDVGVSYDAVAGATSRTDTADAVKQWVDILLVKTAVTGDGFTDGELIADPEGFPFLAFSSGDQGPKTAVFEYVITNPSNVTLEDVALVDDRLGTIDLAEFPDCQTLDPAESCTARASEQFDYDDATAALGSLITNVGTVTATGGGEEVSDTDDATITLVAVQSSILIDLTKEVVAGAGDVEEVDGLPIVNWSGEEYEAGESKTVRYRFTVTNISNSPIIDVELLDPMISDQPLIAVSDGVTLQPGESTVVEVDYLLTADQAFPDGPTASQIDNVATVSGANETRDSFSEDTDDASVFTEVVFAEIVEKEEPLPVTGFGAGGLLPVSMLLISVGAAILWIGRRRTRTH